MNGMLTPGAALLLGLVASGHCALMCGGITAALGLASARDARGGPLLRLLLGYQLGRVASYALAGLLLAGALGSIVAWLDIEIVRRLLRLLAALVLLSAALVAFGLMDDLMRTPGRRLWSVLSPLGRRLLPVSSVSRAFAFGAVWGWMPCGFVYSVLLLAWLSMDPLRGALTMLLFGLGTMPALLASAYGTAGVMRVFGRAGARSTMGMALLVMAVLTLGGPWLVAHSGIHAMHWLPLDCITP